MSLTQLTAFEPLPSNRQRTFTMKARLLHLPGRRIARAFGRVKAAVLFSLLGMATAHAWAQASPFIDETLPVSAQASGAAFALTIKGTGFVPSSVAYWRNGATNTALPTAFVSATQLTAQVSAALIAAQRTAQVTVQNPISAPQDGTSNPKPFPVTLASGVPSFTTLTLANTLSASAQSQLTGDFNGDGYQDLVMNTSPDLVVYLGNGNGSFVKTASLPVSSNAYGMAVGDLNGDGKLDLVAVYGSSVNIFLGNGNGTFTTVAPMTVGDSDSNLYDVKVADVNGDGLPDLLLVQTQDGGYKTVLYTLLGRGNGTFTVAYATQLSVPSYTYVPQYLAIGDFDGNGTIDAAILLAPAVQVSPLTMIMLGDGTGQFTMSQSFVTQTASIGVADFNNDGKLDLVMTAGSTDVYLGNGNGTFSGPLVSSVAGSSTQIGDINGDGYLDLAIAGSNTVSFLLGNGDGTFNTNLPPYAVAADTSIGLADFNNDGRLDIAAASSNGNLYTVLQLEPPLLATPYTLNFGKVDTTTSAEQAVTITNLTSASIPLVNMEITTPGDDTEVFSLVSQCPSSLAGGASCQIDVYFRPSLPYNNPSTTKTATLNISGGTLLVPLTGIAVGTVLPPPPPTCHGTSCY
jgi:hypothetical protein